MVVPTRILEIEVNCCGECPYYKDLRCSKGANITKLPYMPFYDDCPLPWHEKGYDRTEELEAEIASLKKQLIEYKWIPREIKPEPYQHIITTVFSKKSNITFVSTMTFVNDYADGENFETLAWQPAPEPYVTKEKNKLPNELEEAIMKHFVRVE